MNKVAVIVVTFNRLPLLKECICALRNQTYKNFDVIVVNNGSTDGTIDYLDSDKDLIKIHQDNCGGAGGFYAGQKYAFEKGYEWILMMDDDGIPDIKQIEELVKAGSKHGLEFMNALVLDKEDNTRFAFNGNKPVNGEYLTQEYVSGYISPFNGTFLHRNVLEKCGFVKKEMFIWGDEQEYTLRLQNAGFTSYTVCKAIHRHPREKGNRQIVLPPFSPSVIIKPEHFSKYYFRNLGYILSIAPIKKKVRIYRTYLRLFIYYLRTKNTVELKKMIRYFNKGIKNDYND